MTADSLNDRWHELFFGIRRSIRYHIRRRKFYENWHLLTSAAGVVFGSAAVGSLLSSIDSYIALWSAGIVAILSPMDLVVGTSKKAWLHAELAKRFIELEKEIGVEMTEENYHRLCNARLDIEMEEPPVLHVLNMICHNELLRAMGYGEKYKMEIKWYQRCAAHFFDIREHAIQPIAEKTG